MIKINDTKHARLDVVTYTEDLLAHVQATVDLDNGSIGVLGAYVTGEREIKVLEKPEDTSTKADLVLVSAPELIYDTTRRAQNQLKNFYNESGVATRAYYLKNVKKFRISIEGLDVTALSGAAIDLDSHDYYVAPSEDVYGMILSTSPTNAIAKMVRVDTEGVPSYVDTTGLFTANNYSMYVFEVL